MEQKTNIDYRFKIMYALGIIFIVAGHCRNGGISILYDWFPPYSFHLGLFAFCSGYFYKDNAEENIFRYILKKIKNLIIPLYLWNFVYAVIVYFLSLNGFTIGVDEKNIFLKLFILPITDGHQFEFNMGGWFVIPLFILQVVNVLFRKQKLLHKNETFYFFIYLFLGIIGVYLASKGYNKGLWLVLVRTLYFFPFYGLGIYYKRVLEKHDKTSNIKYFTILFSIALVIILIYGKMPTYTPSWCNNFVDGPILPFCVGFLGIAFWFRISKIVEPLIGRSKIINLIGNNTYSIMINHFLGFWLINLILGIINKTTSLCEKFDWNLFKTDVFYFYIPNNIYQFRIIYLVAGIVFSIAIQYLINYAKKIFYTIKNSKIPLV